MPDLPTGTITFLFTDIEASTQLLGALREDAYAALLNEHHRILRAALAEWQGREMDTQGDALFAVFARAADAVSAAAQAQSALADHARASGTELRVRMGLHTGEATLAPIGYVGLDVHRAARLSQVGHGGQVLLSESAAALVKNELPPGVSLLDLGTHRLKDLQGTEHISQLVIPGLVSEFPPLTSLNVIANNLPVQLTDFIGRENEIQELRRRLCPLRDNGAAGSARLLTLTGTGGTGKTRLALQVAAELVDQFPDGVWLVELAPLADPALIPQSIAAALGVREQPGRLLLDSIVDSVRAKHMLLILDNCEHLIDPAARIANTLLRTAPSLQVLATSREALGIDGETSYRVPSLSLPDARARTAEEVTPCESVRLFLARATAVQRHFQLTAQNAAAVAQIARRLDGIPLAIELAAARCKIFSAEQIAARLDDHFRLLTGGSRTALPRQQTLRALIDWSYDLLSSEERILLRRLSVFVGGVTYEAIEAVAGQDLEVLDLLEHLVDKSLVLVEEAESGTRYRLLEMIRQYGRDKLHESGEAATLRQRHLDFFADLVTRDLRAYPFNPLELARYRMIRADADNVRAAMAWGLEIQSGRVLEMAAAVYSYFQRQGLLSEGIEWLEQALAQSESPSGAQAFSVPTQGHVRARALFALGSLQFAQGKSTPARAAFRSSADLFRALDDMPGLGVSLGMLALVERFLGDSVEALTHIGEAERILRGMEDRFPLSMVFSLRARLAIDLLHDPSAGRRYMEQAIAIAREYHNRWLLGMPLLALGMTAFYEGDFDLARRSLTESMETFRAEEDTYFCNMSRSQLAEIARLHGDRGEARRLYREVIPLWQQMGHLGGLARTFECIAFTERAEAVQAGDSERAGHLTHAAQLLGAAGTLRASSGAVMLPEERTEYEREVTELREQMDSTALAQAWSAGGALALEQAIALARSA